ncbi:MAG: hypothetical protein AB7K71_17410 [Polyangiaceae bacterium]
MSIDGYMKAMSSELEALRADVAASGHRELLPLDLSYESLDRLEDFLYLVVDGKLKGDLAKLWSRAGRYVGSTLAERVGGTWAASKSDKKAVVTKLPGAAKAELSVGPIVADVMRLRHHFVGYLRDDTECYDLALRRRQLAELLSDPPARFRAVREDVKALTGTDPGELTGSLGSVDAIEQALKQAVNARAPRAQRRRLRANTILYVGTILARARKATWSVNERIGDPTFGWFKVGTWAPAQTVRFVAPESQPGKLRKQLEYRLPGGGAEQPDDDEDDE